MKVIDYEEAMKCLDEVEDCEDKTYAKSLLEWAINKRTFEAIPLSKIEDIKAVITSQKETCERAINDKEWLEQTNLSVEEFKHYKLAFENCLGIIDSLVSENGVKNEL